MKHLLEIDSIVKSFDRNRVLTDIYLKCETGDIIGLLGRNGSGKSTLLQIIFGVLSADNKFIRINGKVYDHPYKSGGELCYLPQQSFLPPHLKLETTVKLYLQDKARILSFFDDSLLYQLQSNKISELSAGECRYAEIKLLLWLPIKFMLLDEPFNGMSPILIEQVKSMIRDHAKHKGIILTDHDYHNVLDVANRYYLLSDGGLKNIRDKDDLVRWGYMSPEAASGLQFDN